MMLSNRGNYSVADEQEDNKFPLVSVIKYAPFIL